MGQINKNNFWVWVGCLFWFLWGENYFLLILKNVLKQVYTCRLWGRVMGQEENNFPVEKLLQHSTCPVFWLPAGYPGGFRGGKRLWSNFWISGWGPLVLVHYKHIGFYLEQLYIISLSFLRGAIASHAVTTGWYCSGRCWQQVGTKFYFGGKFIFIEFWFCVLKFCFTCPLFRGLMGRKIKINFWMVITCCCLLFSLNFANF